MILPGARTRLCCSSRPTVCAHVEKKEEAKEARWITDLTMKATIATTALFLVGTASEYLRFSLSLSTVRGELVVQDHTTDRLRQT